MADRGAEQEQNDASSQRGPAVSGRDLVAGFVAAVSASLVGAWMIALLEGTLYGVPAFAVAGLLQGLAVMVAVAVAFFFALAAGPDLPKMGHFTGSSKSRVRTLMAGPVVLVLWVAIASVALHLFVAFERRPNVGGLLLSLATVGALSFSTFAVDWLAARLVRAWTPPPFATCLAISVGIFALGGGLLVALGETSGAGGVLSMFGVLRRPELNLLPVFLLLLLSVLAFIGAWQGPQRLTLRTAVVLLVVLLAGGAWALQQAVVMTPRQAVKIERGKGLSTSLLSVHAGRIDSDDDGYGPFFGGGDCDDQNPRIHPGAIDVPGNGIDEDCSGRDARVMGPDAAVNEKKPEPSATREVPEKPNVVLLTIDTLRYDLGFVVDDARPKLSPRLDELAESSTVFEHAYALASYTSKSLGPMLIGRYPSETERTFEHFDRFPKEMVFLQKRLQRHDIRTVSVQGYWYFFFEGYGLERGWDVLNKAAAPKRVVIEGDESSNGKEVADEAIDELSKLKTHDGRFFFWAHWVDPHTEYVRHEDFDFGSESRERYDSEVAFVDHQVGRVVDHLKNLPFGERTVIIVTSDHGEAFGEHGMIRHGFEVWEELVRVPLLVHVPEVPGRRVEKFRSLIDVAPTILDVYDLEIPREGEEYVRGTSLLHDVLAPKDAELAERPVLVDMPEGPHNRQRQAFYDYPYKLITSDGLAIGLYDLEKDPGEKKDLTEENEELLERMKEKMRAFKAKLKPVRATGK